MKVPDLDTTFSIRAVGDAAVLEVAGELDLSTIEAFHQAFEDAKAIGHSTIVVSFEKATYVDSTTINTLLTQARICSADGYRLAVVVPPDSPCVRIFELVGLRRVMRVAESVDTAVE
jgi:anti-sigma B factor antagonist